MVFLSVELNFRGPFIHRFIHLPRFFSIPFNADALAIAANGPVQSGTTFRFLFEEAEVARD